MKKLFPSFMFLAIMLCALLLLSCSSGDEQKPPVEVTRICVYKDTRTCYSTTQASCPAGGELSDFCPYEGSSVVSSTSTVPSSNSAVPLSSSSKPSSSSVADDGCVGVAIAAKDVVGATPRPNCNNNGVSSSSSNSTDGVECDGYCKWDNGCVRIATDPKGVREPGKSLPPITSCADAILNCKNYSPTGNVFSNSTCDIAVITPSSSSVVPSSSSRNTIGDYCNWDGYSDGRDCWPIKNQKERDDCLTGMNEVVVTCPNGGPKISSSSVAPSSSSSGCTADNNTATQYCSNGTMKQYGSVTYGGQTYKTVVIGTQTWMAENLNYNVSGSKCYAEGVSGVSTDSIAKNCAKYGKLYNWATAMALPTSCNRNSCASQISTKHRGICPSGWHISNGAEWITLNDFVGGSAVIKLRATSGWLLSGNFNLDYQCEDTYGFSALPGGYSQYGNSGGDFYNVGSRGHWWFANEFDSNLAYFWFMTDNGGNGYSQYDKADLRSVRCLQD